MSTAMKLSGKIDDRKMFVNVLEPEQGKEGFPAFLNEVNGTERMPGHRVNLFVNGSGDNRWLTMSAPLRQMDEDGNYLTMARTNNDGSFVNDKGEVVESEADAARQFVYSKYDDGGEERIVYGAIANLNIKNEKKDGSPTAMTTLNTKFYSDAEALEVARRTYELKQYEEGTPERKEVEQELSALRRESGTWMTLFIDSGHEKLREMGFEVRERSDEGPAPGQ